MTSTQVNIKQCSYNRYQTCLKDQSYFFPTRGFLKHELMTVKLSIYSQNRFKKRMPKWGAYGGQRQKNNKYATLPHKGAEGGLVSLFDTREVFGIKMNDVANI